MSDDSLWNMGYNGGQILQAEAVCVKQIAKIIEVQKNHGLLGVLLALLVVEGLFSVDHVFIVVFFVCDDSVVGHVGSHCV